MSKLKETFIVAICVAVSSQIYFNILVQGFIIAFSVILFPLFLYNYDELNPIKTALVTGIISPLFLGIMVFLKIGDMSEAFRMKAPEVMFYFTYGILFYLFYYRSTSKDLTRFVLAIFSCDFLSNIVEISIRLKIYGINTDIIKDLLMVAIIRTIIVLIIIVAIKYYRLFLVKEEHENRCRKLILLTSGFKSEIYFMNKNISEIEDVMKKSYTAYKIISENNYSEELKNLALDIAKDVHEIKKGYIRVIKGIEEISDDKLDIIHMHIRDITRIIEDDAKEHVRIEGLDIKLNFKISADFYVEEHFYLVSILRNLIYNSIEAIGNRKNGLLEITIEESETHCVFVISDNGTGIKQSDLEFIFNPGFSTKFDKDTGNIGRGIGLTLVKDLVKNVFKGEILVQSIENEGTVFTVMISMSFLRGKKFEILYCR